uniref:Uncharacterized protein n=1 Tax=Heterorhabditis bacteriophora TaxID=37862 RepID=A0A1I7WEC8_HETBA
MKFKLEISMAITPLIPEKLDQSDDREQRKGKKTNKVYTIVLYLKSIEGLIKYKFRHKRLSTIIKLMFKCPYNVY